MAKARLKRGIELVRLANRIEALKLQEDEEEDVPGAADVPAHAPEAAAKAIADPSSLSSSSTAAKGLNVTEGGVGIGSSGGSIDPTKKRKLSKAARSAIFREVVLAKVREQKELEERARIERTQSETSPRQGSGSG